MGDTLSTGDIGVTITTASGSGLSGGATATSGDFSATLTIDINGQSSVTATVSDEMLIADVSSSNAIKKITLNDLPISSATQTALDNITAGTSTLTIPLTVTVADDGSGSQNVFYIAGESDSSGTKSPSLDLAVGFNTNSMSLMLQTLDILKFQQLKMEHIILDQLSQLM